MIYIIILVNVFSFLIMGIDKYKAIYHHRRISERFLLMLSFFYGSLGILSAVIFFHHKIRKTKFLYLPLIFLILQICLLLFIDYILNI